MARRMFALFLLLVTLSGCWSRVELNGLGLVLGIAVDLGEEDGKTLLTIFLPRPEESQQGGDGGGGSGTKALVMARSADNVVDALALIRLATARQTALDHMRVVLVGEEYARTKGLTDLLNVLATNAEIRMTTYVFVVEGKAYEVFEAIPELRTVQPMNLIGIIDAKGSVKWRLKNLLVASTSKTHSMWMHALRVGPSTIPEPGSPATSVSLSGAALFRKDQLVRLLDERDAQMMNWFLANPAQMIISADCRNGNPETLSAQVESGRVKIQPSLNGKQIAFHVHADAKVELRRSQCTADWTSKEGRVSMEHLLEEDLQQRLERFIAILQESGTDPVGFGHRLFLAYPAYFRTVGEDWLKFWPKADVTVSTNVEITRSGLTVGPANRSEAESP